MKYLTYILFFTLPTISLAQKRDSSQKIVIQCGIVQGTVYYLNGVQVDKVTYDNRKELVDVSPTITNSVDLTTVPLTGTPASNNLQLRNRSSLRQNNSAIFRRSTPYGYYPID